VLDDRGAWWAEAYVRLKPGVSRQQAQQEISAVASRLETAYPATNRGRGLKLWPLWQTPFNNARTLRPTLAIMLAVVTFVFPSRARMFATCCSSGHLLAARK
jgi:putative ABC transport system permease protein